MNTNMTALQLLEASLAKVESKSIQAWAQSDHNKPLWLQVCQNAIDNNNTNPDNMAAYMVAVAIGL